MGRSKEGNWVMEIEFVARSPYFDKVAPRPYPAKEFLPKWYKEMPSYNEDNDGKPEHMFKAAEEKAILKI